jgi:hypothetical protein
MGDAVRRLNDQLASYDEGTEPLTPEEELRKRLQEKRMEA